jgi:hypothetical protein
MQKKSKGRGEEELSYKELSKHHSKLSKAKKQLTRTLNATNYQLRNATRVSAIMAQDTNIQREVGGAHLLPPAPPPLEPPASSALQVCSLGQHIQLILFGGHFDALS